MADYNHKQIEPKWQQYWKSNETFKATVDKSKPKFYSLDMFPYPSGAGLHVGHPLGYIASDIVSRHKRNKGFNVLHPMGFDAFGLPAEQYAIQTGQHPAITTKENIERYKEQLENIGFAFDWDKEVQTCDPQYYKWTQWIFMQIFNSWYDYDAAKARTIDELTAIFSESGNATVNAACDENVPSFSAEEWNAMSEEDQQSMLLKYRLTYLSETAVNWCPELGTVLSNDEVKDGFSERGGFPVIRKNMKQWSMRITAYAERLLEGLDTIDWPEPLKEMQRNWIGKSKGAEVRFQVENSELEIEVFTTRIDTIFGVTFLSLAPESDLTAQLTTADQKEAVEAYVAQAATRSERDRMADVKTISGVFTGSYAINPYNGEKVPVWVADYVLAGYGTGAVMAVPCGDQRDYDFAKHFGLPRVPVIKDADISEQADPTKDGTMINSGFLDGLTCYEAIDKAIEFAEERGVGKGKINYRIRDAIFARQRYWGEPVPVYFKNDTPYLVAEKDLPVILPEVDKYLPTEDGDPPLGRAENFTYTPEGESQAYPLEMSTMPGWAGSSWYWYRYMDAHNENAFIDKDVQEYWENVDLYIGGSEHATGHLLYSRFWNKILFDLGHVNQEEPFKKLINQGMIQGRSNFVYRVSYSYNYNSEDHGPIFPPDQLPQLYISKGYLNKGFEEVKPILLNKIAEIEANLRKTKGEFKGELIYRYNDLNAIPFNVDVNIVRNDELDTKAFNAWRPDLHNAEFILEDGKYICGWEVEKMSKSKYNVVNPDDIIERYGADTLRLYEMFLGPLEQFKPWNTNGIDGVRKFLGKLWRLFHNGQGEFEVSDAAPSKDELKSLHKTIKKAEEDIERYSFNTSVSTFMICVNELSALKCNNRAVLQDLLVVISPYAPHITEELWSLLGHETSIVDATYPEFKKEYLKEDDIEYPVMINGKMRTKLQLSADMSKDEIEAAALADETVQKWLEGKPPKKVIVVPKKIVNLVV
ncbi:leucine--tRNA ligase [Roseivirga pacifica]|uniref:leucine--tRNA ligase n=1 Tax=Roseivirga pacifica TaxID=1267423 RepID=UPI002096207C|nr:class I tRNA ligase family protein [Roseivirga pacifica]MCO6357517.1 leucine--tRNA ligase [Roseivirga pacifica]MCO6367718.1 leucine--tRNA ligase [Roseivirga pacifica]MCO6369750.1 leucine--tRNA ligase [Roseivirga pacifica]MCO6373604.1 leucine--tRNA ligase [Roseivirga pacifica]MCO6377091.1 leucine--tRNA ligase [Roseivirga pacifica]